MTISAEHMQAWRSFLVAHAQILRQLEKEMLAEHDLLLSWYDLLVQLHEAGGSMRMGELASRLLISRSATTRFIDRVEQAGLVERCASAADGRGTDVRLTSAGYERLKEAAPTHLRGIEQHFAAKLTAEEARSLTQVLDRLR